MVGVSQIVLGWLRATSAVKEIQDDSHFYGQSPPVYPCPTGNGTGNWAVAYQKATALVKQMTLQEKADLTYGGLGLGHGAPPNGCSGQIQSIKRLGFPGLCMQDAGNGVRATDFVSGFPSGIHVGASWNRELSYQRGHAMGGEFRAKGINVMLGPVVGPLGRIAVAGRNWEGFSNDPYLCGALGFETVRGAQERGVITSTKHYIGNEQETNREPKINDTIGRLVEAVSSNIDDATLHELYLWPFQDVLRAGAANIMCSYNRVNNSYGCHNSKLLNGVLKGELGFQGFVVSDWNAQHVGVASANAGLDMAQPSGWLWQYGLPSAVKNGSLKKDRLDDMATRIIATWYQLGQDQGFPEVGSGLPSDLTKPHKIVDARDPASKKILLDGAIEGHVLVKNTKKTLPLKKPRILSLFGYSATIPGQFDISQAWVLGTEASCPGCRSVFYPGATGPQIAMNGTLHTGGGSGANTPTYISSPYEAIAARAYEDGTALFWDFTTLTNDPTVDASSDACLVFINAMATEALDREVLHDTYSDNLILNVASKCANTIVVIHNAGIRLVDAFIEHENVTAVIFAHLPGQDSGRALAAILYGDVSPSGRLPYTVAKDTKDYGAIAYPALPKAPHTMFPQDNFTEGVYIDYRAFDKTDLKPRFEFGFGLSYTTFTYSALSIAHLPGISHSEFATGKIVQGGQEDLWDVVVQISATVTNTGKVYGKEVAQLYIGIAGGPVRQLRGFQKIGINPGTNEQVKFELTRRDLSVWDVVAQAWKLQKGSYQVWVGASSRDLRLKGKIEI